MKPIKIMMDKMQGNCLAKAKSITVSENKKITKKLVDDWNLGPEFSSSDMTSNSKYWKKMSIVWSISEPSARRQLCSNCEYAKGSPEFLEAMEHIPRGTNDIDGGGRVWCKKFSFICHNLRTCMGGDWD